MTPSTDSWLNDAIRKSPEEVSLPLDLSLVVATVDLDVELRDEDRQIQLRVLVERREHLLGRRHVPGGELDVAHEADAVDGCALVDQPLETNS